MVVQVKVLPEGELAKLAVVTEPLPAGWEIDSEPAARGRCLGAGLA